MKIYKVFSVFTSRQISLLEYNGASVFLFLILWLSQNKLTVKTRSSRFN